ncbi:MAG: diacylglycerol kinase family lipid kinase [Candidatus Schekmanbacteria bacterium]|nr:diacylglycerol kinase family lipid kinase [Candidatus Schekmanbacteria bacterium]
MDSRELAQRLAETSSRRALILNPAASGGRGARVWPDVAALLERAEEDFVLLRSERPGHLLELSATAREAGAQEIVAVGGDGTVHEVLNGIFRDVIRQRISGEPLPADLASELPALSIVPLGRGDDLARALAIPDDPLLACGLLGRDLGVWGHPSRLWTLDVGVVEFGQLNAGAGGGRASRVFLNIAGCGFDGEVTARANALARLLGPASYPASLLFSLLAFQQRPYELTIDGESFSGDGRSVVVANGRFFGSGMMIAPRAELDDGRLDVVVIGPFSRWEVATGSRALYRGAHLANPKVFFRQGRAVEVRTFPSDAWIMQVDGEVVGRTPLRYELLPRAVRVRVPA